MKTNLFLKAIGCFFISLLLHDFSLAQPQIEWQKSLGGTGDDIARCIQQTSDGGYIVAGHSNSNDGDVIGNHGVDDCWVVKLDATGTIQWKKALGGVNNDQALSVQETSDGGFIVAGESGSNDGDVIGNHGAGDFWVVKLDAIGTIQWQKSLGGTSWDGSQSIKQTLDGGYIVAGYSVCNDGDVTGNHGSWDCWVVKLDATGTIQWQKALGGLSTDWVHSIQQTSDGGYIVAGHSCSNDGDVTGNHGGFDYWIVKLDTIGTIQWQKALGGTENDNPQSIQQTTDGGYIIAGYSNSNNGDVIENHGDYDAWVVKFNGIEGIPWQKSLGGTGTDMAISIKQTADGGYILAGSTLSLDGDVTGPHMGYKDIWVVKLDAIGVIKWQKSLGGTGDDYAFSIQQTADGGYIVAGVSMSNDGDVTGNHGNRDYWIVKLSATSDVQAPLFSIASISPNPTTGKLNITLNEIKEGEELQVNLVSLLGQTLISEKVSSPKFTLDIANQARGIYMLHIQDKAGNAINHKIEKL